MVDLSKTIVPKSDQLNADDLIAGPRDIVIRDVRDMGGVDQPIAIFFEGDDGKPYKPCKSMRRALVFVWGPNGEEYLGRAMRLFNDPSVTWGGEPVGGIRISHMSNISEPQEFPLTATRGRRSLYRVEPMPSPQRRPSPEELAERYEKAVAGAKDMSALLELLGSASAGSLRAAFEKDGRVDLRDRMTNAERKRREELEPADEEGSAEDDFLADESSGLDGFPDDAD